MVLCNYHRGGLVRDLLLFSFVPLSDEPPYSSHDQDPSDNPAATRNDAGLCDPDKYCENNGGSTACSIAVRNARRLRTDIKKAAVAKGKAAAKFQLGVSRCLTKRRDI